MSRSFPPRRKLTHAQLVAEILRAYGSRDDLLLFKNHVGVGLAIDDPERKIKFGVPGSADILGVWRQPHRIILVSNPDSFQPWERTVDRTFGQFIGIECKVGRDVQRENQRLWMEACRNVGGIYVLARSVRDCFKVLGRPDGYQDPDEEDVPEDSA